MEFTFSVKAENSDGTSSVKSYIAAESWGGHVTSLNDNDNDDAVDDFYMLMPKAPEISLESIEGGVSRAGAIGAAEMAPPPSISADQLDREIKVKVDRIPPMRILDLDVSVDAIAEKMDLSWTAPGDDWTSGNIEKYTIILEAGKNQIWTNVISAQGAAGERVTITISLEAIEEKLKIKRSEQKGVKVAVEAEDEAGNRSPKSNAVTFDIKEMSDLIPPGEIHDLNVAIDAGRLLLSWTAPGDDKGNVVRYDIVVKTGRNETCIFTASAKEAMGEKVTFTISLEEIKTRVKADKTESVELEEDEVTVIAIDEAGNQSPESNAVSALITQTPLAGKKSWSLTISLFIGAFSAILVTSMAILFGLRQRRAKRLQNLVKLRMTK